MDQALKGYLDTIPVTQIEIGDRFRKDLGDIESLKASIEEQGLLSPIVVKMNPDYSGGSDSQRYLLMAGHRRLTATVELGLDSINATVYPAELDELDLRVIELMENIARSDLNYAEEAKLTAAIHALQQEKYGVGKSGERTDLDRGGWTQKDTGKMLKMAPQQVSANLKMAQIIERVPEFANCGSRLEAQKKLEKFEEGLINAEILRRAQEKAAKGAPADTEEAKNLLFQQDLTARYIVADFFEKIKQTGDSIFDLICCDPPYNVDIDNRRDISGEVREQLHTQRGEDESYLVFIKAMFDQCLRVARPNAWLICWHAIQYTKELADIATTVGWDVCRVPGMWVKSLGNTATPNCRMRNLWEPFLYMRKGQGQIYKPGRANTFIYNNVPPNLKIHPTEKPIEMLQDIMQTFAPPEAQVLVPFLGSGNDLLAASNALMSPIGYELNPEYRDAFTLRVLSQKPREYKSLGG